MRKNKEFKGKKNKNQNYLKKSNNKKKKWINNN